MYRRDKEQKQIAGVKERDTQLSWAILSFHAVLLVLHLYRHVRFNVYACIVTIQFVAFEFFMFERDNFTRTQSKRLNVQTL